MAVPSEPTTLVSAAVSGDRRALARLISVVEEDRPGAIEALKAAFAAVVGSAHRIGVTGAPGSGKSTLVDEMIRVARARDQTIAVLAVDPTSPFSGGAVLGDRVRMQDHALDAGVYVRSMASRGHLGGLSEAAPKALVAIDAAGFDHIAIETVGVGQDEVEIASAADTVLVVLTPGWGDGVQAAKAGILEIGDVFVVNKADRAGVGDTVADLKAMLTLGASDGWEPPIIETVAARGDGVEDVWAAIVAHRAHLGPAGLSEKRAQRRRAELETALAAMYRERSRAVLRAGDAAVIVERVAAGEIDPWSAARDLAV